MVVSFIGGDNLTISDILPCIGDCIGPDELHREIGELSILLPGGVTTQGLY